MDVERDEDKPDPKIFFEVGYDPKEKSAEGISAEQAEEIKKLEQ